MQLVVCGVRRPVQLKAPEHGPGQTGQCGPTRGEGVPGASRHRVYARTSNVLWSTICEVLEEQSRLNITKELKWFIQVDNNEVVKIGNLENNSEAIKVV